MNRWHFLFLLLLCFGLPWIWWSRVPATVQSIDRSAQPAFGYPAPDFTLKTLAGETLTLSQLRGTPIVLNFWATWCVPCRNELPALQKSHESYGERVRFLAVDQAEPTETVQSYVDQLGLTFTVLLDTDQSIAARYKVGGLPTTFFIDAEGVVRGFHLGEMNRITLAEQIKEVMP